MKKEKRMFEPLGTPAFMLDEGRGVMRSPIVEILVFFLLTLVAQVVQSALVTPFVIFYILSDGSFLEISQTGDMAAYMAYVSEITEKISASPLFQLLMLFSTAATVIAVLIYVRLISKRSLASLGLTKRPVGPYAVGFLLGVLAFAAAVGFSLLFGSVSFAGISGNTNALLIVALLLGYAVQGFSEEFLCRGYLMTALGRSMPLWMAVVSSAFAFAALHVGNTGYSLIAFVNVFLFGVLMALYMIRRGSLWGAAALHAAWNFAEGVLTNFRVSGMPSASSVFSFALREGDEWIHGGAFGPEGGIAVTCVLTVGIVLLLMMKTKVTVPPMTVKTEEK